MFPPNLDYLLGPLVIKSVRHHTVTPLVTRNGIEIRVTDETGLVRNREITTRVRHFFCVDQKIFGRGHTRSKDRRANVVNRISVSYTVGQRSGLAKAEWGTDRPQFVT